MQCVEVESLVIICFSVILRVFREVTSRYWKVYRRFSVPYIDQWPLTYYRNDEIYAFCLFHDASLYFKHLIAA
jgi:hypothetical protein